MNTCSILQTHISGKLRSLAVVFDSPDDEMAHEMTCQIWIHEAFVWMYGLCGELSPSTRIGRN
jgi:hypothetical protein